MIDHIATKHQDHPREMSEEVREIFAYRPHSFIRRGNAVFLVVLLFLLSLTWFIRYPDIIQGSLKLVSLNEPKLVVTKSEGKLVKLLVSNEQHVTQGEPLAFLQSTANFEQVISLRTWINQVNPSIVKDSLDILFQKPLHDFDQLGELQAAYQDLQVTLKETEQVLAQGYYEKKRQSLLQDLQDLSSIAHDGLQQQQLLQQDYDLQMQEYKANESLAKDKIISRIELNQNRSKLLTKEQSLHQMATQLHNNSIAVQGKQKEILELKKYITDQHQKFRSVLFTLKSKVDDWAQKYMLVAPETGKILFTSFLQENQWLGNGQELFYLQPAQSSYYGQMMTSQIGLGKIRLGQKALIRVNSYPSNEFGYLTGYVRYISNFPSARDSFLIRVDIPDGLKTNYSKNIMFRNNLDAQAEVITDDRRLLERFLGKVREIVKR